MKRILSMLSMAFTLSFGAQSASAEDFWNGPQPEGATQRHAVLAENALKQLSQLPDPLDFGFHPATINWSWRNGKHIKAPISNMTRPQLRQLLANRYQIQQTNVNSTDWSIMFHADDGKTHFCVRREDGTREFVFDRHVVKMVTGPAGLFYTEKNSPKPDEVTARDRAIPIIYDPDTGELTEYRWINGTWRSTTGWVQDAYPDVAQEFCSILPRKADLNRRQSGDDIREMVAGAKMIKGAKVAFENTNKDPLTAEIFYWLYPPAYLQRALAR